MYFYRHIEGHVIPKPDIVVEAGGGPYEYFSGPFVQTWWYENDLLRPVTSHPPPEQTK